MAESIVAWITGIFGVSIGKLIGVLFISIIPIIELRGAIPVAFAIGISWQTAMICSIIGNLLPIPFILLFLDYVFKFMKEHNIFKNLVLKMEEKAQKGSKKVEKYKFLGLLIFVAIPLPGTGGWTGALIASVMKMNKKHAFLSISGGVIIAGIIVTLLTYGLVGSVIRG